MPEGVEGEIDGDCSWAMRVLAASKASRTASGPAPARTAACALFLSRNEPTGLILSSGRVRQMDENILQIGLARGEISNADAGGAHAVEHVLNAVLTGLIADDEMALSVTVGLPGTEYRTTDATAGQTGHIATRPINVSGNTLGPIAVGADPSGSALTPAALIRGR